MQSTWQHITYHFLIWHTTTGHYWACLCWVGYTHLDDLAEETRDRLELADPDSCTTILRMEL